MPPSLRALALVVIAAAGAACVQDNLATFEQCELDLVLEPAQASVGDTVAAVGSPVSDRLDTSVRLDGFAAEVGEATFPEGCSACDSCRNSAGCEVCQSCEACADDCAACSPSIAFIVPDVPPGTAGVVVTNRFGVSPVLDLEVVAPTED